MNYSAVIFDVDGTLLDTREGVLSSIVYTIEKHGLLLPPKDTLLKFIGPPIQRSFQKYYELSMEDSLVLAATFRDRYKAVDLMKAAPYEGIPKLLGELKEQGIALGVATYKREDYALRLLEHFELSPYMSAMYGADTEGRLTKKDIIVKCQQALSAQASLPAVMIGDSDNDAIASMEIPMDFLGVTYGFGFKTKQEVQLYPHIGCAHRVKEIKNFLI